MPCQLAGPSDVAGLAPSLAGVSMPGSVLPGHRLTRKQTLGEVNVHYYVRCAVVGVVSALSGGVGGGCDVDDV